MNVRFWPLADTDGGSCVVFSWARVWCVRAEQSESPVSSIDQVRLQPSATPAKESAPVSEACALPPVERLHEFDESDVFENGASITYVEISGSGERKWAVCDSQNRLLGYKRQRAAAVALTQRS